MRKEAANRRFLSVEMLYEGIVPFRVPSLSRRASAHSV